MCCMNQKHAYICAVGFTLQHQDMKNAAQDIITEFNEDRSFWMSMIQGEIGNSRLSVADFTKQVMTEMVGEKGLSIYAQNTDLEMTIKKIAASVRVHNYSEAKESAAIDARKAAERKVYL